MSYSSLKIDRTRILTSVYGKCILNGYENYRVGQMEDIDGTRHRLSIEVDGESFFLDFFFNKNAKTTIQTGQGANKELQEDFAKHIYEDSSLYVENYVEVNEKYAKETASDKKANDTIVYKKVDGKIFEKLVTVLKNEESFDHYEPKREESDVTIYKFYDKSDNEVTITHFSSTRGHTIMIQGKPKMFFAICVAEVAELISAEQNIAALNEFYGTKTTLEEIEKEFDEMFVNSKPYLSSKLKKCICQALQNRYDLEEKFDPTYLAAPAERAIEGHIRVVLGGFLHGHKINVFEVTQRDEYNKPIKYELQKAHWDYLKNNQHKIESIGRAYTYMALVRNKLQHWDNPNELGADTTKILASNEVDNTIMNALKLIEEYYS